MSCGPSLHRSSILIGVEGAERGIDEQHADPNHRNFGAFFAVGQLQIVLQITSVRSIVEQIQLVSWFGGGYFVVIELQGAAERGFLEDRHGQYL